MSRVIKLRVEHRITNKQGIAVGERYANGSPTKTQCYYIRWDDGTEDWYAASTVKVLEDLEDTND